MDLHAQDQQLHSWKHEDKSAPSDRIRVYSKKALYKRRDADRIFVTAHMNERQEMEGPKLLQNNSQEK